MSTKRPYLGPAKILRLLLGSLLLLVAPPAWTQSDLFEIRYEPTSTSALESSGRAQITVVVDLVNSAPIANADSFLFNSPFGSDVCVFAAPAPGVLVNDSDPDGDPLSAFGVNLPAGLTLNPDGSFVFQSPFGCSGTESFTYVVSDGNFVSNQTTVDINLNIGPIANPGGPYFQGTGIAFNFDGSASTDNDGTVVAWDWDFGDGNQGSGEMPSHTYALAGIYDVTLTVTDDLGAQDSAMTTAEIIDPPARASGDRTISGPLVTDPSATSIRRSSVRANGSTSLLARSRALDSSASGIGKRGAASRSFSLGPTGPSLTASANGVEGGTARIFSANYSANAGTATPGADFIPIPTGVLQWSLDDTFPLQLTFEVTLLNDDNVEQDETVLLTLDSSDGEVTVLTPSATLTIVDDDALGSVQFRQSSFQVMEDAGTATILVDLTGSQSGASSVDYSVAPGTASEGEDFEASSGTLTWDQGIQGTRIVSIGILDDNLLEDDETVVLTLSNPVGIELGSPASSTLVIRDNDQPAGVVIERGDEQTGKVGSDLAEPLVVRVTNASGQPVAGATVTWELVEGAGEFLEGLETVTDSDGLSENRLRLGTDLGEVQVRAAVPAVQDSAMFTLTAELRLSELTLGATERPVAEVLDTICNGDNLGGMRQTCDDLARLPDDGQRDALSELSPKKTVAQGDTAIAMMRTQYDLIADRLRGLRRSQERSFSNLALQLHDIRVPVEALADTFSFNRDAGTEEPGSSILQQRGGGASADTPGEDEDGWLGKRLGLFLSGVVAVGDRPTVENETGFDLDTTGLTFGVDYKFSEKLVWGGAIGYMSTNGDLKGSGGTLDSKGLSLSTYLLYMPVEKWFFEAVGSYGDIDFETERNIAFPGNPQTARADPQGNQSFLALGGGYDAQKGASTFSLVARGSYLDVDIDPYREQDAPGMQLSIAGQKIKSLLASAGLEYYYTGSVSWGVLTPGVRLLFNHEFEDDLRFITASFVDDPQSLSFAVPTSEPDRDYLRAGLSLTATLPRGISAYATYDNDFSRDDLSLYVVTAGLRLELR